MERTSSRSSNEIPQRDLLIVALAVILIAAIYLLASRSTYAIGFPLDNSWIHQTYARNLALNGEWAFRPGITSAGSTSPLWSALLAVGFLLKLSPYIWTYFLGAFTLFTLAVLCEWAVRKLVNTYRPRFPWVGIFIAFEWHFVWAGMSGMETLLHGLIVTTVLVLLMTNSPRYFNPWPAHWSISLDPPRRLDSDRSCVDDNHFYRARYSLTINGDVALFYWFWGPFWVVSIIQSCHWRRTHAKHFLCKTS